MLTDDASCGYGTGFAYHGMQPQSSDVYTEVTNQQFSFQHAWEMVSAGTKTIYLCACYKLSNGTTTNPRIWHHNWTLAYYPATYPEEKSTNNIDDTYPEDPGGDDTFDE